MIPDAVGARGGSTSRDGGKRKKEKLGIQTDGLSLLSIFVPLFPLGTY